MFYTIRIVWLKKHKRAIGHQELGPFSDRTHATKILSGIISSYKNVYRDDDQLGYTIRKKYRTGRPMAQLYILAHREPGEMGYETFKCYPIIV